RTAVALGSPGRTALPLGRPAAGGRMVTPVGGPTADGGAVGRTPVMVLWWGAVLAIAAATASGLSKGEVERIYLPFVVWLLPLAGLLPAARMRVWLAAQLALALVLEALLWFWW
ncbi:MAG: hypothetical protein ACRDTM_10215, partial [Micromonosporaceae bacterium]